MWVYFKKNGNVWEETSVFDLKIGDCVKTWDVSKGAIVFNDVPLYEIVYDHNPEVAFGFQRLEEE